MGDVGRTAFPDQAASIFAAFGAQVEDPIGVADDVEVVLDDDDGVAKVGEAVENFEKFAHVVEVEASGGLVEEIKGAAGLALGELARQLHPLRFAATEGRGALAEMDVAEAHVDEGLKFLADQRHVSENGEPVFNGEVEDVGDGVALESYGEGFLVVAASVADFTLHVDVGHEIHFNTALPVALAGFTSSSGHVEAEAPRLVAALAGLRQHGEKVAEGRKDLRVGGRVGARGAADGGLVDADNLVDLVLAGEGLVGAWFFARSIKILG